MSERCLLCVDDERIILNGLKNQLRGQLGDGMMIEVAESGEEGLEVIEELLQEGIEVPVVISDQLMPGMKGEEFLARVHDLEPRALTILLTGQATAEAVGAAVNTARLYRFLAKPWSRDDLLLTVREAIRAWEQARAVERREAELAAAHAASLRFVPAEFLTILGREKVADVRFGDCVDREITVFFSKLRQYSAHVTGRDARDAFRFVNEYVQRVETAVRAHGGFLSAWKGEAILALFPEAPDAAVAAGIDAQRALRAWSRERAGRGERPVDVGIGVNTGALVLGTVGGEDRLQCDLVGDTVNLAARVEGLTRHYATPLLIAHRTQDRLERPDALRLRAIDRVRVVGKRDAVTLLEVLDALPEAQAATRWATAAQLQEARAHLTAGEPDEAAAALEALLAASPDDGPAKVLLRRSQTMRDEGVPAGWSGVAVLDFK